MADPATSSFLSIMISWFTPTSLFLFVNLVIGTIVLSSRFGTHKNPEQHHQDQLTPHSSHQLVRTPSLLDRVRSFNFSHYNFEQPNPEPEHVAPEHVNQAGLTRTPSLLERLGSMDFSTLLRSEKPDTETRYLDPNESEHKTHDPNPRSENLVHRSKSESSGGAPAHHHEQIRKSVSEKSPLGKVEGNDDVGDDRRPRVEKTKSFGGDEGVDAKADDFINRFKQQLRLQRLDSLLRYKEMLQRK